MVETYKEALKRIIELEEENAKLLKELEYYRSMKKSGRKKHDEKWTASYNDFVIKYEGGMSIKEIVKVSNISKRTAYRYKSYYDQMRSENMVLR